MNNFKFWLLVLKENTYLICKDIVKKIKIIKFEAFICPQFVHYISIYRNLSSSYL